MTKKTEGKQKHQTRKHAFADMSQEAKRLSVIVAAIVLAFVFGAVFPQLFGAGEKDGGGLFLDNVIATYRHPLTGQLQHESTEAPHVFGVMIDNHAEAQPQSGIDEAFLVIEAPVEAGISRYLAFFTEEQDVEKIGPVRSARPYYLDWNNELDAMYAHVGGSPEALDLIASGGTFDLNEYWWGGTYFWRQSSRFAPHNTYTSTQLMREYLQERMESEKAPEPIYGTWKFKGPSTSVPEAPVDVEIEFWAPYYTVQWEFDVELGRYKRSQHNKADVTTGGNRIMADNVAVVVTDVKVIDGAGRRAIETIGEGVAYVLQDGRVIEGVWKKLSVSKRLRFYTSDDEEIEMNSGVTWIEIVPDEDDVVFD